MLEKHILKYFLTKLTRQLVHVNFLEIGAFDGITGDNIYPFATEHGWRGTLVEPVPHLLKRLKENYRKYTHLEFLNKAVSDQPGHKPFYYIGEGHQSKVHYWEQLGSFDKDYLLSFEDKIPNVRNAIKELSVECVTINELLDKSPYQPVNCILIDAEGYDAQIVGSIDFTKYSPEVIIYEIEHMPKEDQLKLKTQLREANYETILASRDIIACHSEKFPPHEILLFEYLEGKIEKSNNNAALDHPIIKLLFQGGTFRAEIKNRNLFVTKVS